MLWPGMHAQSTFGSALASVSPSPCTCVARRLSGPLDEALHYDRWVRAHDLEDEIECNFNEAFAARLARSADGRFVANHMGMLEQLLAGEKARRHAVAMRDKRARTVARAEALRTVCHTIITKRRKTK